MSSLRAQPELIYMTGCAATEFPTAGAYTRSLLSST